MPIKDQEIWCDRTHVLVCGCGATELWPAETQPERLFLWAYFSHVFEGAWPKSGLEAHGLHIHSHFFSRDVQIMQASQLRGLHVVGLLQHAAKECIPRSRVAFMRCYMEFITVLNK
jgi:hypothetical protein